MFKFIFSILVFAPLILLSAHAQKDIEDVDTAKTYKVPSITVTTMRAFERENPVPFVEITESEIQQQYTVHDIPTLLNSQPSILTYSQSGNAIGYSNMKMRGFGQRRISVMINGIPQNDPEDHNVYWIDFPDLTESLDNIQIQRGAGMASYGAAAIGGSINLTTSNFADKQYMKISSGIGWQEYNSAGGALEANTQKYLAEFSSGLVGNYAFYGRLSRINSGGYRDHSWTKLNSYFFSAVRFDENLTTQLNLFGGPLNDGLVYNGIPKSWITDDSLRRENLSFWVYDSTGKNVSFTQQRRDQAVEEFSQPHYELLNDWSITDDLTLKSALFYYTGSGYFDYDGSWASSLFTPILENSGYEVVNDPQNAIIRAYVGNKHGGWIPRLIYDHGNGKLTVGTEIRLHRSEHWGKIKYAENLPSGYDPDFKFYYNEGVRDIFSVFAREMYYLSDDFSVTAEAQLVRHLYALRNDRLGNDYNQFTNIDGESVSGSDRLFDIKYWFLNPRVGYNWNITENHNTYGMVAYTSREPRMRNLYAADDHFFGATPLFNGRINDNGVRLYDFSDPLIKPESMVDIELGWTYRDPNYYLNTNFYWMEYFDELVKSGRLDIFGSPITGNAPRTRHFGLEIVGSYQRELGSAGIIKLSGNATLSRNQIIEYDYITADGTEVSLADNPIAGFPDFMAYLSLAYQTGDFHTSIGMKHVGEFRTDNFGDMLQINEAIQNDLTGDYYYDNLLESYTVFNMNISYTFKDILSFKSMKMHGQINNMFDKLYAAGGEGKEFFPAAERNFFFMVELGL